jgi:hypothetical protein
MQNRNSSYSHRIPNIAETVYGKGSASLSGRIQALKMLNIDEKLRQILVFLLKCANLDLLFQRNLFVICCAASTFPFGLHCTIFLGMNDLLNVNITSGEFGSLFQLLRPNKHYITSI